MGIKILVLASLFQLFASLDFAKAQSFEIKEGTFTGDGFRVDVKKTGVPGWYEIRADGPRTGRPQFVKFLINSVNRRVVKAPYGTYSILSGSKNLREFSLEQFEQQENELHFRWSYGGWRSSTEEYVEMRLNSEGSLISLNAETKIARYSLPNGFHSGPIKFRADLVVCGKLAESRAGPIEP